MTRLDRMNALLAKVQGELAKIRASSHPLRAQFVQGWEKREAAVRAYIADETKSPGSACCAI